MSEPNCQPAATTALAPYQLLPPLSEEEYRELKEDIRRNGVLVPVEKDEHGNVLDGHHRDRAVRELRAEGVAVPDYPVILRPGLSEAEKRQHVRALNLHRRHLTAKQRRELIADQLRETPEQSNRQVAENLGVDGKTVKTVRQRLESTAEIPQLGRTTGKDGKVRPAIVVKNRAEEKRITTLLAEAPAAELPTGITTPKQVRQAVRAAVNEETRQQLAASVTELHADVRHGDFRQVSADLPDNSVDLVLTDPPYDEESIPLYGDLASLAARVLKPGGSLICYAGHHALPQIIPLLSERLRWWWILSLKHAGRSRKLPGKWVIAECKPLLWFVKEGRANNEYVADLLESEQPDKNLHDWEQSPKEASYLIERLTEPGGLVLDPMCGSGTTLAAAIRLGRRALGCEIDEERAKVASARMRDVRSGDAPPRDTPAAEVSPNLPG
jgi:site-specific DNA-methyltransferase (adenine-specific)